MFGVASDVEKDRPRGAAQDDLKRSTSAGSVYAVLVENQLAEEATRKESFESRGVMVITTSAALVGLLFGFSALVTKGDDLQLQSAAIAFLTASAFLFVAAAILSILCNWPLRYRQVALDELERLTQEQYWNGDETVASRRVAEVRVMILGSARTLNALKGRFLLAAMTLEVLAVAALAAGISVILMD